MSKEQEINRAIAEVRCKCKGVGNAKACNWNCPCGNSVMSGVCECRKNYFADLNACHEFEKDLTPEQEPDYVEELKGLLMIDAYEDCPRYLKSDLSAGDSTYRATAPQRCEAFLRTVSPDKAKEIYGA